MNKSTSTEVEVWSNVENPDQYPKISASEMKSLLRCLRRHKYSYREGLQSKDPPTYLSKGSFLHSLKAWVLEHIMKGEVPNDEQIELQSKLIQAEAAKEGRSIVEEDRLELLGAIQEFVREQDWDSVDILSVEEEIKADIGLRDSEGNPVLLHLFIDAVVRERDSGDVWIVDHKTAGRRWSQGQFLFDYQARLYTLAWEAMTGERPNGILWNFYYKKGRWEQRQQFAEIGELETIRAEAQSAVDLRDTGMITRMPHWGCNDCWFQDLCYIELTGDQVQADQIREREYIVDEDKAERFDDDA